MNMLCTYGYQQIIDQLSKKKGDVKNALVILKDVLVKQRVYGLR